MTEIDQPFSTLSGTVFAAARKTAITDYRSMIDRMDTPVVSWLGPSSANSKFRFVNDPQPQLIWLEDAHRTLSGSLETAIGTDASTSTGIVVTDGSNFRVGDQVLLHSEKMWVSAISTNTLTVSRGWDGTSAATHAQGVITIQTVNRMEGAEFSYGPVTDLASGYNYIQIFDWAVRVTDLQRMIGLYGADDELTYQADKAVPELMRNLERAMFLNATHAVATSSTPYHMAGFKKYITTNSLSTTAANLTLTNVKNLVLSCYLAGGRPDAVLCSHLRQQTFTALLENSGYLRVEQGETVAGMAIKRFRTPWGPDIDLVPSPHCPDADIFIVDKKHIGIYEMEPPTLDDSIARTGTYQSRNEESIYSLVVQHNAAHAYLNLSA